MLHTERAFTNFRAVIEYRWAGGRGDRVPALIAELLRNRPAVLLATGGSAVALAAKAATKWTYIVSGIAKNYFLSNFEDGEELPPYLGIGAYPLPKGKVVTIEYIQRGSDGAQFPATA